MRFGIFILSDDVYTPWRQKAKRYLNGFFIILSIAVGAILTGVTLPTTGEAVNPGSILLWTGVSALLIGGSVYWMFLRTSPSLPTGEVTE